MCGVGSITPLGQLVGQKRLGRASVNIKLNQAGMLPVNGECILNVCSLYVHCMFTLE